MNNNNTTNITREIIGLTYDKYYSMKNEFNYPFGMRIIESEHMTKMETVIAVRTFSRKRKGRSKKRTKTYMLKNQTVPDDRVLYVKDQNAAIMHPAIARRLKAEMQRIEQATNKIKEKIMYDVELKLFSGIFGEQ